MIIKNKKSLIATGFVGFTAATLISTPAMAAGTDSLNITHKVEKAEGKTTAITKNEFTIPAGYDESSFALVDSTPEDDSDVVVKDVVEDDEVVGKTTTVTVKDQGEWIYTTDVKGNFLSVEFTPVKENIEDSSIEYTINDKDGKEDTGKITFDFPDVKADGTKDTADKEKDATTTDKKDSEKSDEKKDTTDKKTTDESKDDEEVATPKELKRSTLSATTQSPTKVTTVNPAAPSESISVPNLSGTGSKTKTSTLKFGEDGKKLSSKLDKSSVRFTSSGSSANGELLNAGKGFQKDGEGTWSVTDDGFSFKPIDGIAKSEVKATYIVEAKDGGFSKEGTLTLKLTDSSSGGSSSSGDKDSSGSSNSGNNSSTGNKRSDSSASPSTSTNGSTGTDNDSSDTGSAGSRKGSDNNRTTTGDRTGEGASNTLGNDSTSSNINGAEVHTGAETLNNNSIKAIAGIGAIALGAVALIFGRKFLKD